VTGRVRLVAQVLALACVAGLLALLVWKLTHEQHAPPVGSPAPAFTLPLLDGSGSVSLASLRGHPVVLNFWASWCESCKAEARVLEQNWLRYRSRGVAFVGVDDQDLGSQGRAFVRAHSLTFPMLDDGPDGGSVTGSYGVSQLPETYIVGANGKIVAHFAGPITGAPFGSQFRTALKEVS
jgi:cytochrome c biogenesis protein CcmG, thiol:disulfide interchange protein DsbE